MLPRFTKGTDFADYIRQNQLVPGFLADLCAELKVSEDRLLAALVTYDVLKAPSALVNLYTLYLEAPGHKPSLKELVGDDEDVDKLHVRQRARVKQFHRNPDPEGLKLNDLIEEFLRLQNQHPTKWISEEFWGAEALYSTTALRSIAGNISQLRVEAGIKLKRGQQKMQRDIARHVDLDLYRKFYTAEFLPFANQYNMLKERPRRVRFGMSVSDLHDLEVDPYCLAIALDRAKDCQPDIITLNGDIFDNPEFGRWDCDPRNFRIKERFDFAKQHIFGAFREAAPRAQIDFIIGNHDWRILKVLANKTPEMKVVLADVMGLTLGDIFGIHEFGINLVSKGDLDFSANSKKGIESQLRSNYQTYLDQNDNPMYVVNHFGKGKHTVSGNSGHVHRPGWDCWNNEFGEQSWMVMGAMAKTNAHYVDGMDQAQNGFGFFSLDTLKGHVQQEYVDCTGWVTHVHGKYYYRTGHSIDQEIA